MEDKEESFVRELTEWRRRTICRDIRNILFLCIGGIISMYKELHISPFLTIGVALGYILRAGLT